MLYITYIKKMANKYYSFSWKENLGKEITFLRKVKSKSKYYGK